MNPLIARLFSQPLAMAPGYEAMLLPLLTGSTPDNIVVQPPAPEASQFIGKHDFKGRYNVTEDGIAIVRAVQAHHG